MTILGPTSNTFYSQRLRLHYLDWGNPDAPPLILQHGGRDHCRSWDWVAEELRHDWHVICPDLRGHGDSAWSPEGQYGTVSYVYDFAQLIHTLDLEEVTIIAHSLGGNIATRYAGLYPDKVRKFVNIEGLGPSPDVKSQMPSQGSPERLRNWIEDKRKAAGRSPKRYPTLEAAYARMKEENAFLSDDQARHLTIHGANRNEDGTWSWKFDNYLNVWSSIDMPPEELEKLWRAISCPILMLWGLKSFASSPGQDGRMDYFQNATLIEYPDAGHWLHHDQLGRFLADVKAFI
ncbi:MAG: alpha/beta hydrolase [Verrucomicrobiaceae bacterium]|nr:MAG: alpha/beta hydrolase [Verrucomicrobiaceae bacterium]